MAYTVFPWRHVDAQVTPGCVKDLNVIKGFYTLQTLNTHLCESKKENVDKGTEDGGQKEIKDVENRTE
jgi:hypothetical protein